MDLYTEPSSDRQPADLAALRDDMGALLVLTHQALERIEASLPQPVQVKVMDLDLAEIPLGRLADLIFEQRGALSAARLRTRLNQKLEELRGHRLAPGGSYRASNGHTVEIVAL